MRIKVCLIIPTLVEGGAEKQLSLLAAHLDRDRFDLHVVVLTHSGPYEKQLRDANIPTHLIGKRGKLDPFAFRKLTRKLKELKPHIVHTWLFAANSYGRLAARRAGIPVIIAGERCVDPWKSRWQFAIDRRLARATDTIVTNTSAVVQFYARHGIPESKFSVIPNAVLPPRHTRLTREQLFERLKIPPRCKVVGAVGRLWKQKGYPDLIWAGELLQVAFPDMWFVIIGDGPDLRQLQQYRDKSNAMESVRFAGHRHDASELMSAFDLLWNGSLYEGQSNTILEAMSQGVPVIASDIPGNRDLIVHDRTGYLFKLGDVNTLARLSNELLRDDAKRAQFSQAAEQLAGEQFSLDSMIAAHEALYQRMFEMKSRSS